VQVRVRLFGDIAEQAGKPSLAVELGDEADLGALLTALDRVTGRAVSSSVLFNEQTIHPAVAILVNGNNVLLGKGLATALREGDQVSMMPLISGGQT
jgi:MoaD family protein